MSKSKIGPKNRASILRMELDGEVLGKKLKEFLLETTNLRLLIHIILLTCLPYLVTYTKRTWNSSRMGESVFLNPDSWRVCGWSSKELGGG